MNADNSDTPTGTVTRTTRQRRAVSGVLGASDDFQSAQVVHDLLRRDGEKIGLATVYRALQTLAESGEVDVVKTDSGKAVYRQCSPSHHHLV